MQIKSYRASCNSASSVFGERIIHDENPRMSPRKNSRSIDEKSPLAMVEKRLVRIRYNASERVIEPHAARS
jgi:hypothetical protein